MKTPFKSCKLSDRRCVKFKFFLNICQDFFEI
nr:MAG TPA: hypothetical protein [Caudoviricetes sp.]